MSQEIWIAVRFKTGTKPFMLGKIYRNLGLFLIEDGRESALNMKADFKARVQRANADEKARQLQQLDCVANVTIGTKSPVL